MRGGTSGGDFRLDDYAFRRSVVEEAEAHIFARTANRREAMLAFDAHGREILEKLGDTAEISFTREEIQQLTGRAYLVVHNHDDDTPPFVEDLVFAAGVGLRELVAFGGKIRWRLIREPSGRPTGARYSSRRRSPVTKAQKGAEQVHSP